MKPAPSFIQTDSIPGRTIAAGGREMLFFSGYAYLGMNYVPAFTSLVKEGIDRYGLSMPSSRISNTRLALFEEMEALLSHITGQEDTVCLASGFSAGNLAAGLLTPDVLPAPGTHPAVSKTPARENTYDAWIQAVKTSAVNTSTSIVADAVNIFTPCINDFSFLKNTAAVTALIDDSHGIGLTGNNGNGVADRLPQGHNYLVSYSLSKAFNLVGGAISCSREQANRLRSRSEYTAATALSPAFVYAFIKGQSLYQQQRQQLQANTALFAQMTAHITGLRHHTALPVFVLPESMDEKWLYAQNVVISSFAYPDPAGKKIQRIIINALHTENDLQYLADTLGRAPGR